MDNIISIFFYEKGGQLEDHKQELLWPHKTENKSQNVVVLVYFVSMHIYSLLLI